jgi:two-component system CheB/CheR fusion protein
VVSTIREPLIILNKDLKVRSANKAYYNKFQTTEEETVGKYFFEQGSKQWDIPDLKETLESILPQKKNVEDFEIIQKFSLLGERVMLLSISCIISNNSEGQSILLAIEDITEKRKVEIEQQSFSAELERQVTERTAALHEANISLQNANSDLQQFAYIASHDLQEPLRKIRTFASMLCDRHNSVLPNQAKELVTKISGASQRMSYLVRNVLDFSKIMHGTAVVEKTDLNIILHKIRDDFDLLITEKKAVIICEHLPVIQAIPSQMEMLFCNLISNALKFVKKDIPPLITITSRILPPGEVEENNILSPLVSYCEINFQDNGIGFEQQYADKIFAIFARLHSEEAYAGTGIGLATCKKIVLNHRGAISVTSNKDEGALFQVILPL